MLFSSPIFIFVFLPLVILCYFLLNRFRLLKLSVVFLLVASLVFYSWWRVGYLPLFAFSIIFNYLLGRRLGCGYTRATPSKFLLIIGIILNLLLLGYYKYTDFILGNINALHLHWFELPHILLPLAISFFTFQQIAYLVDSYRGETIEYDFFRYALFVSFFPQLIAGPIVHHREMMPQFERLRNKIFSWQHLYVGLIYFSVGLFKKAVLADGLSTYADLGFADTAALGFTTGWLTSLSYTFQLYFDFSGYCDMAVGAARMLNIHLPVNFDSPYKAANIQEFWRRWHITLSRWLRDYIYIPLGGNRCSIGRTYLNLFLTFLIGGIWHGAAWTFVLWGVLHGAAQIIHRLWLSFGIRTPRLIGVIITFMFVNFSWVFFRAESFADAGNMLRAMLGYKGFSTACDVHAFRYLFPAIFVSFFLPNCNQVVCGYHGKEEKIFSKRFAVGVGLLLSISLLAACINKDTPFLYFNF